VRSARPQAVRGLDVRRRIRLRQSLVLRLTGCAGLSLAPEHRRWIGIYAVGVSGLLNFCLTGGIAWLGARHQRSVPLWQGISATRAGLLTDTIGTFFFLPFLTTLLLSLGVHAARRGGELPPLAVPTTARGLSGCVPKRLLRRALLLGLLTMVTASVVAVPLLFIAAGDGLSRDGFVVYKAVLAFILGLGVAPFVALCAMADDTAPRSGLAGVG
jgi:hypothetical protein